MKYILIIALLFGATTAKSQTIDTLATLSSGKWHFSEVTAAGQTQKIPEAMQENLWVEMRADKSFHSTQGEKVTKGTWKYNPAKRWLQTIEVAEGEEDDVTDIVIVAISAKSMTLDFMEEGQAVATMVLVRK